MSDNPLEMTPDREALIEQRAHELMDAADGAGTLADYRERADELVRMEMAGQTGQLPLDAPEFIDEAILEENLGEQPGGPKADQGERRQTPMTRTELRHEGDES
jgi:hypothetical protein